MKSRLINLLKFLKRNKLTKESSELAKLLKIAVPLPPGEEVDMSRYRHINLEGPEAMPEEEVVQNLKLKDIFLRKKDDSFINQFKFLHFFRGTSEQAVEFINKYSNTSNPTEMSVVGTRGGICEAMNNKHFRGNGYIFVMTGEPVSAFYFDASSSVGKGFMDSESYKEKLRNLGIDTEEYLPKVVSISEGKIHSFFYDEASYGEASEGRHSDYHEFILKNAKVEYMVIDNKMRLDKIHEELSDELEYGTELYNKIRFCNTDIVHDSDIAVKKLEQSSKTFVYQGGYHDRQSYWNGEKFTNLMENLNREDDEYFGDRITLSDAIDEAIDNDFVNINNLTEFISSMVGMGREAAPLRMHGSFDDFQEKRERHIDNFISEKIKRIINKNMDDINSISYHEDNLYKLLFGKGYEQRKYKIGDKAFDTIFDKGINDFRKKLESFGDISEDNIEDLSSELDRLYGFLYATAYIEGSKYRDNTRFENWQSAKERYLSLLEEVMSLPNAGREFAELIKAYEGADYDIYSFIEDKTILMGKTVKSPISEAHSIVRDNLL